MIKYQRIISQKAVSLSSPSTQCTNKTCFNALVICSNHIYILIFEGNKLGGGGAEFVHILFSLHSQKLAIHCCLHFTCPQMADTDVCFYAYKRANVPLDFLSAPALLQHDQVTIASHFTTILTLEPNVVTCGLSKCPSASVGPSSIHMPLGSDTLFIHICWPQHIYLHPVSLNSASSHA